jgi:hypothetical protein
VDNELQRDNRKKYRQVSAVAPWSRDYADCPSRRKPREKRRERGAEERERNNYRFIHRSLRDVLSDRVLRPLLTNVRRAGRYPGSELRCIG